MTNCHKGCMTHLLISLQLRPLLAEAMLDRSMPYSVRQSMLPQSAGVWRDRIRVKFSQHACSSNAILQRSCRLLNSELAAKRQLATSPMAYLNCQALLCRLAAKQVDEGGSAAPPPPSGSTPAGHDDGLGPILPDFGSLLHADKPDARRSVAGIMSAFRHAPEQLSWMEAIHGLTVNQFCVSFA